jgi:hypothetical protein
MLKSEARFKSSWITSVGAITGLAQSLGIKIDETGVCGVSGFAFRLAVADQVLPVFNSSYVWFDVFQSTFDRLGIVASIWKSGQGQLSHEACTKEAIAQAAIALGKGLPSMVWESFEFGLLTGLDTENEIWVCDGVSGINSHQMKTFGKGEVPIMFAAIPYSSIDVDQKQQALMSLRLAVSVGFTSKPSYPSDLHVVTGVEAYKKWSEQLEKEFNLYGNSLLAQIALEARRHAALYLARVSKLFDGVPQNLLLRASERFAQVNSKLNRVAKCYPFPGKKEDERKENIIECQAALADCYIMENEGLQLIATAIENLDANI